MPGVNSEVTDHPRFARKWVKAKPYDVVEPEMQIQTGCRFRRMIQRPQTAEPAMPNDDNHKPGGKREFSREAKPRVITRAQMSRDASSDAASPWSQTQLKPKPAIRPSAASEPETAASSSANRSPWQKPAAPGERAPAPILQAAKREFKPSISATRDSAIDQSDADFEDFSDAEIGEPHPAKGQRERELRIYGRHAVAAIISHRIDAVRKVYYHRSAQNVLPELLRWCAANKIGYREVELEDLFKLSGSEHHEGVVLEILKPEPMTLAQLLESLKDKVRSTLLLLDGVANPHNIGAILRNAAHFDADAVLLNPGNSTALSGAAYRVAEGGAEAQPFFALQNDADVQALKAAGYSFVVSQMRQAKTLWGAKLPKKLVLVFGAESSGVSDYMHRNADIRVQIPGSGKVESLNVAQSVAIVLAEIQRQAARA
jgi:RNA methyltransferase, TrmH family